MNKVILSGNVSIGGYFEDSDGNFDFTEPDEEVHRYWNEIVRDSGAQLMGRSRMAMSTSEDPGSATASPNSVWLTSFGCSFIRLRSARASLFSGWRSPDPTGSYSSRRHSDPACSSDTKRPDQEAAPSALRLSTRFTSGAIGSG